MTGVNKHIVVLMGGLSAEREVSLVTGRAMVDALHKLGYMVTAVDPNTDLALKLSELKPDIVLNALHGTYGEDGSIPGLLEVMNIPYTHSGVTASAIAMDKSKTKALLRQYGVRSPAEVMLTVDELEKMALAGKEPMARPFVIKPLSEGSSVGVIIVMEGTKDWFHKDKWKQGARLLVEEYIPGQELSAVVIRGKAMGVLELRPRFGFYDYKAKYTDGVTDHIFPAELPDGVYKAAMEWAAVAHNSLGCRTVSRSDLRFDPTRGADGLYFLEINTHPGCTPLSIVPEVAAKQGISFEQLVGYLLADAKCELV